VVSGVPSRLILVSACLVVTVAFASGDPIAIPSQAFRHAD
jgi:hypothetical protein